MADGRHIENLFLAISRRHIGLTRGLATLPQSANNVCNLWIQ